MSCPYAARIWRAYMQARPAFLPQQQKQSTQSKPKAGTCNVHIGFVSLLLLSCCMAQLTLCLLPGQSNTLSAAISRSAFGQIPTQCKALFVGIGPLIDLAWH